MSGPGYRNRLLFNRLKTKHCIELVYEEWRGVEKKREVMSEEDNATLTRLGDVVCKLDMSSHGSAA